MIYYVCKYTPIELFRGFGEECSVLEEMPENFEQSDQIAHANLCGFGKSVIQAVLEGKVEQLVLVNCCDSMRRVYDIVESTGKCKFLYMLDLPHDDNECEKVKFAGTIRRLKKAYEAYSGKVFDKRAFIKSFITPEMNTEPDTDGFCGSNGSCGNTASVPAGRPRKKETAPLPPYSTFHPVRPTVSDHPYRSDFPHPSGYFPGSYPPECR